MAQFKDVFSNTAKVILSLLIISAAIGVAFPILSGLGFPVAQSNFINFQGTSGEEDSDTIRKATPTSAWVNIVDKAITNQCVMDGMNQSEVVRAIGEPGVRFDDKGKSSWTWHPQKLNETTIFFTSKGNVYLWSSACKSLRGIVTP
jgi:hypothetical protein